MTIPIPHRASGFLHGKADADVNLDVFVDIQCPHSRSLWPTLMEVMSEYSGHSVNLKTHLITLSNHRQAWDMSLALFAFAQGNSDKFYGFASYLFENQATFYNSEFLHKTHHVLKQFAADLAVAYGESQKLIVDKEEFLELMASDEVYVAARTPIRYAATRSVWATPTIFVNNGVNIPVNHSSTVEEWRKMLAPLMV